ncbi:UBP1-associated protein 2C-like [Malania oleifera]|uniref:UBP1-associated protein 2C-like n=1 Tax=Malania oleifera TaxID=397392 RepID=UPI0025AEB476|nr:UBP1-associated protein 2C-like [Malania oleifera]XP_057947933.1 UBP1-associated protein 2C-like [Malania oleifera]XP_057947934.1 UBP1-associated protein 2C-like [Malania oleifera]XP_057947935.1 UBP1-associated protein 2C-like [Malania oleifera]XP_057947936.1 UBP1-associated protein 2C-like [Malania oleifera]XP_057947937.1 UBP1-associated protein 2C-like [Malania oleifera]XP_057947938.1 UBP1-associated protein 2C-like [Malania oleifera]
MDLSKKRKTDENGAAIATATNGGDTSPQPATTLLSAEDARKILDPLTQDQLLDILQAAVTRHSDVLDAVRSVADRDPSQRKLFIRGLGWDTTTEKLRHLFSSYGELEEAVVIVDKATGKSKGYGFITFKHIDGALLALKEPSKKIDGRMTVTQLAALGASGPAANITNASVADVSMRKIYVGSVPYDVSSDRLLGHFLSYGEIEEGPLGFDKQTGKSRGFAFFVYKTEEGARASLVDPIKNIDGHQVVCKLAIDGKKGKPGMANSGVGDGSGDRTGMPPPSSMAGPLNPQYGAPPYGGFSGAHQGPPMLNSPLPSSIGAPGLSAMGGSGGYGAGVGGTYGGSQYGGPASGEFGGLNNAGSSLYRLPPSSVGMSSGGYPESGNFGLSSAYPAPPNQPSSVPRVPTGGMYQGMPPYY